MSIAEEEPTATLAVDDTTYDDFSLFTTSNLSSSKFLSDMDFVPQELQLPLVIIIGLLGFLAVLGLSKLSSKADIESSSSKKKTATTAAPATPVKTPVKTRSSGGDNSTPLTQKTGTVMTPAGRRSARIARTRRKEE